MTIAITEARVRSILTRTSGFLRGVCSHSLQPYRGCSYGRSLCGVGCYAQHNRFLTRGAAWGRFLEARVNAAEAYRTQYERERRWARRAGGAFAVFMSSSTDPFVPHERRFRVTQRVLEAMGDRPPDRLIVQTHSHGVIAAQGQLRALAGRCDLRVHISIESDRESLPGLPRPASAVAQRFHAARSLARAGLRVVITVAPLLPIEDPEGFFARIADCADAVVIDHYVGGDGSKGGARTARTPLPRAMAAVEPDSTSLGYRERMLEVARRALPGRVGVGAEGFAGIYS